MPRFAPCFSSQSTSGLSVPARISAIVMMSRTCQTFASTQSATTMPTPTPTSANPVRAGIDDPHRPPARRCFLCCDSHTAPSAGGETHPDTGTLGIVRQAGTVHRSPQFPSRPCISYANTPRGGLDATKGRALTHTADNAPAFQVEIGDIGVHYYCRRYGGVYFGASRQGKGKERSSISSILVDAQLTVGEPVSALLP